MIPKSCEFGTEPVIIGTPHADALMAAREDRLLGGTEARNNLIGWANQNLTNEDRAAFKEQLDNPNEHLEAMAEIQRRRQIADAGVSTTPYGSPDELRRGHKAGQASSRASLEHEARLRNTSEETLIGWQRTGAGGSAPTLMAGH